MSKADLPELRAFAAVAALRSFRRAADELGLSPSTMSHTMRGLEERLGVRLLHRTTRSVALTDAGERLIARLRPALDGLNAALAEVDDFREQPLGRVRINAPELAIRLLLQEVAPAFHKRYPSIELDLVSEGRPVDIVREGFDAGVRLSGAVPQDMVAVRFGGPERCIVVGAPAYLKRHPRPESPGDLMLHECIRRRLPSGKLYHWEFERRAQELRIQVPGKLTLDHEGLMLEAAIDGYGLAYVFERAARPALKAGRLRAVLEDWCPEFPGMQLYYPGHRHVPGPLRAFIEVLKGAKVR